MISSFVHFKASKRTMYVLKGNNTVEILPNYEFLFQMEFENRHELGKHLCENYSEELYYENSIDYILISENLENRHHLTGEEVKALIRQDICDDFISILFG